MQFFIAGVKHHDMKKVIDKLKEGDILILEQEPTNKYNSNAVKILSKDGTMLGYVPDKLCSEVTVSLDLDEKVTCAIISLNRSARPWEQCEVEILSDF